MNKNLTFLKVAFILGLSLGFCGCASGGIYKEIDNVHAEGAKTDLSAAEVSAVYFENIKDVILEYDNAALDKTMYDFSRNRPNPCYIGKEYVGDYLYESDIASPCLIMMIKDETDINTCAELLARASEEYEKTREYDMEFVKEYPAAAVKIIRCMDGECMDIIKEAAYTDIFWKQNVECIKDGRARLSGKVEVIAGGKEDYYRTKLKALFEKSPINEI